MPGVLHGCKTKSWVVWVIKSSWAAFTSFGVRGQPGLHKILFHKKFLPNNQKPTSAVNTWEDII